MKKMMTFASLCLLFGVTACSPDPEALYKKGLEATGDEKIDYLSQAAELGHAKAQYCLGEYYGEISRGNEKLFEQAIVWYRKAAEQGHVDAQYSLGSLYKVGYGIEKDLEQAAVWFTKAADQGHERAQRALESIKKDLRIFTITKNAEKGDVNAQYELAEHYANKRAMLRIRLGDKHFKEYNLFNDTDSYRKKDLKQAVEWYRKAAEQGHSDAQYMLGRCYEEGMSFAGIKKDFEQAANWYRKAAEQGHASAQTVLGECYCDGMGVEEDVIQGIEWYRKAAEQNHLQALIKLSSCYKWGKGVEIDFKKSKEFTDKAKAVYNELVTLYRQADDKGDLETIWRLYDLLDVYNLK